MGWTGSPTRDQHRCRSRKDRTVASASVGERRITAFTESCRYRQNRRSITPSACCHPRIPKRQRPPRAPTCRFVTARERAKNLCVGQREPDRRRRCAGAVLVCTPGGGRWRFLAAIRVCAKLSANSGAKFARQRFRSGRLFLPGRRKIGADAFKHLGRETDRFRQRRMRMDGAADVDRVRAHLDGQRDL